MNLNFSGIIPFASYFVTAILLLVTFIFLYVKFTPYNEFTLIQNGNKAAAFTLSGAMVGFGLTLLSSIYYTQSLTEMIAWALITGVVQFSVFLCIKKPYSDLIEKGVSSAGIFVGTLSIVVGLINAVCISH